MPKLVIVESPAKAKTISRFLGKEYQVEASFGHVRDLPETADDVPAEFKKKKWGKLGVNVEDQFQPLYIVPGDKKRHVDTLVKAARTADELLLATDEDREGESISWHVLELIRPKKGQKVSRIVFHEVTPEAIAEALRHPRQIDENLVRAQETRRILDRLYGYTLSPLLWKKVKPRLSAGRVQSVAVRLIVMRERERRDFASAEYWDLNARLKVAAGEFGARLVSLDGTRLATGRSFDDRGQLTGNDLWLRAEAAEALVEACRSARPWTVAKIEAKPGQENPPPPFMTSTLQQEANRKLGFPSRKTMQIAQQLYEGIDLGGERVGLITYMRTDSLTLAERALDEARAVIGDLYGGDYVPAKPNRYRTKSKNAQEAHEAIRPTSLERRPQDVERYLEKDQRALYELIWKRMIACQMKPAEVERTSVDVEVESERRRLVFAASGKRIVFPGFLRAYAEGSDDPEADLAERETILPAMKVGEEAEPKSVEADRHATKAPARYTEASLVKRLEELGIGRPSTYASIIGTVQERGYVNKVGNELIPTFTAFAVTELLEDHFDALVDTKFTARMEDQLDEIAEGERDWVEHLRGFYAGADGIQHQVDERGPSIPFPQMELGVDPDTNEPVVVRVGKFGAYVQVGEGGKEKTVNIPEEMAPAELTVERALDLLRKKTAGPEALGVEPQSGRCVFVRKGPYGTYLEIAQTEDEKSAKEKPRRVSLPEGVDPRSLDEEEWHSLLKLPRDLGKHPDSGESVVAAIGRYGAYVKAGEETRNLADWRSATTVTLEEALAALAQPKSYGRGRAAAQPVEPILKLVSPTGELRVMPGRYGPYVTDGKTNATVPKSMDPSSLTAEQALELIRAREAAGPSKGKRGFKRKGSTSRSRKSA